jgi:hypothetical protein
MCKAEAIFFRRNDLCAQTIYIHLTLNELCAAHFTYFSQINRFVHIQKPEIKRMSGICVAQNLFSKKFSAFVCTQMLLVKKKYSLRLSQKEKNRKRKAFADTQTNKIEGIMSFVQTQMPFLKKISTIRFLQMSFIGIKTVHSLTR